MRRLLLALGLCLAGAVSAFSQTTVNLSVVDTPDNQSWNNGTWQVQLIPAPGNPSQTRSFTLLSGGGSLGSQSGSLSSTGTASSILLPANVNIGPSGTVWQFTVCSQAGTACSIANITVTTSSPQSVTISPPSIRVAAPANLPPVVVYTTTEISSASIGSQITVVGSTPTTPALQTCTAISGNSCTTWAAAGGGGSPNAATIYAWDPKYGVVANTQVVCDATATINQNTVSTPATDVVFTAADVGKKMFFTTADCQNATNSVPVSIIAEGTVTGFTDAHHLTVSNNATAGCTPTSSNLCTFVWGTDDTAALQAAWQAAASVCGGSLVLPAGGIYLHAPPGATSAPACTGIQGGGSSPVGVDVHGQGKLSTFLVFSPSTTFGNTVFSVSPTPAQSSVHDFQISSFSAAPAAANNKTGLQTIASSGENHFYNLYFFDYFPSASQLFTALVFNTCASCWEEAHDITFQNSGGKVMQIGGGPNDTLSHIFIGQVTGLGIGISNVSNMGLNIDHLYFENNAPVSGAFGVAGGALDWSAGTGTIECVSCIFQSGGSNATSATVNIGITGATFICRNCQILNSTGNASSVALKVVAGAKAIFGGEQNTVSSAAATTGSTSVSNAGTLIAQNTAFPAIGTGVSVNNASGGVLSLITGGNTFASGITNAGTISGQSGQGILQGTCTGTVTSATTVGLYGLGQTAATTCTSTTVGSGVVATKAGTIYALYCTATAGNQATDACKTVKNGVAQTQTCSLNGVATCTDGTVADQVTFVQGDILSIEVIGGTSTTLANVKGTLVTN